MSQKTNILQLSLKSASFFSLGLAYVLLTACSSSSSNIDSTTVLSLDNTKSSVKLVLHPQGTARGCFDHTMAVDSGGFIAQSVPLNCTDMIEIIDGSSPGSMMPLHVEHGKAVLPTDGELLDNKNVKVSVSGSKLTFHDTAGLKPTSFTLINNAPSASSAANGYSPIVSIKPGNCFIDKDTANTSVDNTAGKNSKTFTFTHHVVASGDGCNIQLSFDQSKPIYCSLHFTHGKLDASSDNFSSQCLSFMHWYNDAKNATHKQLSASVTKAKNQLTFSTSQPVEMLPYAEETLKWQSGSWLTAMAERIAMDQPSKHKITSQQLGFEMLVSAGMMELMHQQHEDSLLAFQLYKASFENGYGAVQLLLQQLGSNGLLPAEIPIQSQKNDSVGSATDSDMYIAMAEHLAYEAEGTLEYKTASSNMVDAIYKNDVGRVGAVSFLKSGSGQTTNSFAYTRSLLPFMYLFSQYPSQSKNKVKWLALINDTINLMKKTQGQFNLTGPWAGILGATAKNINGDNPAKGTAGDVMLDQVGKVVSIPAEAGSKDANWYFSDAALHVPMALGEYVMVAHGASDSNTKKDLSTAHDILSKEVTAINKLYGSNNYLSMAIGDQVGSKAYIYKSGALQPSATSPAHSADDAIAGQLLLAQLGLHLDDAAQPTQVTELENQLVNSSFGSAAYYKPFYKILAGLFMDGVFTPNGQANPLAKFKAIAAHPAPSLFNQAAFPYFQIGWKSDATSVYLTPGFGVPMDTSYTLKLHAPSGQSFKAVTCPKYLAITSTLHVSGNNASLDLTMPVYSSLYSDSDTYCKITLTNPVKESTDISITGQTDGSDGGNAELSKYRVVHFPRMKA